MVIPLNEITPAHVRKWQSQLLADKVAPTYAKTINNQLSAIFNYACKYYGLGINPARLAGSVGKKDAQEMSFWTVEQFNEFIPHVKKLPAPCDISADGSRVRVYVIPTNEELVIASDTEKLVSAL